MMRTVVLAPDKFKGSASAADVARCLGEGMLAAVPTLRIVEVPVADGGEGTVEAALRQGFRPLPATVRGPTGGPVDGAVAVRDHLAVVELAQASGLTLVDDRPAPLEANTYGTGELIEAALDAGCTTIVLGLGGSASTDGGAGMLQALGARLLDGKGRSLPRGVGHPLLTHALDLSGLDARLRDVEIVVATDVDNPLLGRRGAAAVFGPQKGADAEQVSALEAALERWAGLLGRHAAGLPGSGAAGGVGFAALAALNARVRSGVDVVLELVGFADRLREATLVITGEGSLDDQSLGGKAPVGVARAAREAGVPVIAVAGGTTLEEAELKGLGFDATHTLLAREPDLATCLAHTPRLLREIGREIATDL